MPCMWNVESSVWRAAMTSGSRSTQPWWYCPAKSSMLRLNGCLSFGPASVGTVTERDWVRVRAVVMTAPGAIEVTTIDDPTPGSDDVIVEVAAVGLCGTDLHILAGEHGVLPVVPGHEVTGSVVAAGADARDVRVGDRVAVDPSLPCRACRFCRRG